MRGPRKVLGHFCAHQRGSAAVEFAIVIPVFLLCAMALFQVGFGVYAHSTISRLAEDGLRHLLFQPDDETGARQAIFAAMSHTALDPEQLTISMRDLETPYRHIELRLDYLFQVLGPFPLPERVPLHAVVMVPIASD
ncbi:MAG TPA: TadE/TadG family type IV pilus assembly protein [Devosia sp.]|nr:TadE/TadG family type IV pilus assembly protein [Devosia sp.]